MDELPDKIYLQLGYGDEETHTWSAEKTDWEPEVEYTLSTLTTELADALEVALTITDEKNGWGKYNYMESSKVYEDASNFREAAKAALAKIGR